MILNFGINSSIDIQRYDKDGLRIFITGQSGSGKSYLAKVIIEEFANMRYPIIIIDPEGEYAAFKELYSTIIVGGLNADTSFESLSVGLDELIEVIYKGDIQFLIFDTSQKLHSAQINLHADILESVFKVAGRKRSPIVLLVEEAHIIAPEGRRTIRSLELAIEVAKRGRKRGIQSLWVTQRPADISKQVISQCNIRFFGRLQDPADINALRPYIRSANVTEEQLMGLDKKFYLYDSGRTRLISARNSKIRDLGSTPSLKKSNIRDIAAVSKKDIIERFTNPIIETNYSKNHDIFKNEIKEDNKMDHRYYQSKFFDDSLNSLNEDQDTMKLIFSESIKNQLILRGKLTELKNEKSKYLNELKKLGEDLDSGMSSLIEIENKVKYYKEKIEDVKKREKILSANIRELPHEKIISNLKKLKLQIKKLDGLLESGKIKETTYHELRNEFIRKMEDLKIRMNSIKSDMQELMVTLNTEIVSMEKELELLYARFEIGEINKENYNIQEKELRNKLSDYESCLKALKKEQILI